MDGAMFPEALHQPFLVHAYTRAPRSLWKPLLTVVLTLSTSAYAMCTMWYLTDKGLRDSHAQPSVLAADAFSWCNTQKERVVGYVIDFGSAPLPAGSIANSTGCGAKSDRKYMVSPPACAYNALGIMFAGSFLLAIYLLVTGPEEPVTDGYIVQGTVAAAA